MGQGITIGATRPSLMKLEGRDRAEWHRRASALYESMQAPAAGLVRRAYGSAFSDVEVEDIYSSAWLGTLRALERKAHELTDDEVRSYLFRAVANQAGKEIRRRKRKPIEPLEKASGLAETAASVHERAEAAESRYVTRDLLASLPPRRRAVMLLRYGWELDPSEICSMVHGLSPRAYRKEITKGVDELAARIRMVEDGQWCRDREPVLKAFAAGTATEDQTLQATQHISHCRSCGEFVGKLTGHLHDLGSSILVPGSLEAIDGHSTLLDKARDAFDGMRDTATSLAGRSETSEGVAVVTGARGAGAASAGVLAKLSAVGTGTKAALACSGGLVALSSCVVAGVGPLSLGGADANALEKERRATPPVARVARSVRPAVPAEVAPQPAPEAMPQDAREPAEAPAAPEPTPPDPVLSPETPPTTQQFGVESAAAPTGAPPPQTAPSSNQGAVAQEFGP